MKKIAIILMVPLVLSTLSSCSDTQSLQEYYVDNAEDSNFLSLDLPASLLNLEQVDLEEEQRAAVQSLKKLNILAFKKTERNDLDFQKEKSALQAILQGGKYTELMKLNTPYGKARISYLGKEEAIDEVIVYGDNPEKGFLLVRILGQDMNPAHLGQFLQALGQSDYKGQGLEQIQKLLLNNP